VIKNIRYKENLPIVVSASAAATPHHEVGVSGTECGQSTHAYPPLECEQRSHPSFFVS